MHLVSVLFQLYEEQIDELAIFFATFRNFIISIMQQQQQPS